MTPFPGPVEHLMCLPKKLVPTAGGLAFRFCWPIEQAQIIAIERLFCGAPMRVSNWDRRHEVLCSECQLLAAIAVTNKLTPYLDSEVALKEIARLMALEPRK